MWTMPNPQTGEAITQSVETDFNNKSPRVVTYKPHGINAG